MKQFQYIVALLAFVAGLAIGGPAMAQDEHGGDAVESSNGDERAASDKDKQDDKDKDRDPDEHAGEEAEEEEEGDEHSGDGIW